MLKSKSLPKALLYLSSFLNTSPETDVGGRPLIILILCSLSKVALYLAAYNFLRTQTFPLTVAGWKTRYIESKSFPRKTFPGWVCVDRLKALVCSNTLIPSQTAVPKGTGPNLPQNRHKEVYISLPLISVGAYTKTEGEQGIHKCGDFIAQVSSTCGVPPPLPQRSFFSLRSILPVSK